MQENQATLRNLSIGRAQRERVNAVSRLLHAGDGALDTQVRYASALLTVHYGALTLETLQGDAESKRRALLAVALEILETADRDASAVPAAG
ncbi:hypothetical protein FHS39_002997 [Streptomyces olivoverticillatus]|uniref:TetR family transcriptional regulator n=1 Tax=Streptomyces olivoverticillatus TaxID=66427 RepID=A0A7W7LPC4_9ACTN|nr:hypothetical protein [Streptomyces olivoverticillatus]